MIISANTKIAALIKANPAAIDAIASINAHFKKLQNPVLRKIFASRVTIADAAKIGKCDIKMFFDKLRPLGFIPRDINETVPVVAPEKKENKKNHYDVLLDVRDDISSGKDPFRKIMQTTTELDTGKILLLVNSFEPSPLICILKERRYTSNVLHISSEEVHTFIRKNDEQNFAIVDVVEDETLFNEMLARFDGRLQTINVRQLPMPQPMVTILKSLETLPDGVALFVYHKKIPMFLLPELKEKNFSYVIRHTQDGIEMLIYKRDHDA